ncbi:MAG: hypothetical protein HFH53_12080 [Hespellia sp.]|nr:hypothetical protein [Hespellia sp.]
MKRVIGFGLFCVVLGMILVMLLPYIALEIIVMIICLVAGYHLFFC